jgi:hypothetical protein
MKKLLAAALFLAAPFATTVWAATPAAPAAAAAASVVTGEVLEVKDVDIYTYLLLKTKDGETWAAVSKAPVKKGTKVTIENYSVMKNFESKALKKTFPTILFGNLAESGTAAAAPHAMPAKAVDTTPIKVPKATGANARTVAEIVTKSAELKDKPVQVRGKVVKYNAGIMGKNWIHLRDGSGAAANGSDDLLVTTSAEAKLGDVLTASGVVRVDKDFGSGYSYKVIVEDAKLQP